MLSSENLRLRAENEELSKGLRRLEAKIVELEKALENSRRGGKRQAAPFSRGPGKRNPRKPGRKKGHAPARRETPEKIDRVVESERLLLCPKCGGEMKEVQKLSNIEIDLPAIEPVVTRYIFEKGRCSIWV